MLTPTATTRVAAARQRSPRRSAAFLLGFLAACGPEEGSTPAPSPAADQPPPTAPFHFVDVAAEAGLTRVLHAGRPGKDHLLDSAGAGVAWLDFDQDGWLDAYLVNGWLLDGNQVVEKGQNALYRNRGDGTFEDVTDQAGVGGEGHWGSGVAVADQDGDGWPDLLVTNFGPNVLYRNRGDGTFVNVAAELGIEVPGWNTGAAWFDANRDGHLDLYIAGYIDCTMEEVLAAERSLAWKGVEQVAFGPFGLPGARDHFFLADGAGGFTDATEQAGLEDRALAFGFTVRAADLNEDGLADLYVANDSDANNLYRNRGDGTFQDVTLWTGAAFDSRGAAQAGMGMALGDMNGDLLPDLLVTNFAEDFCTLYEASAGGLYDDVTVTAGLGEPTFLPLSWGTCFADLDQDGDLDLVIVSGHIYPQVDNHPEKVGPYAQVNQLFENLGEGRFQEVTGDAGAGFAIARSSRGLAAGDYDNDGDLDLLISNLDAAPTLLENRSRTGAWLAVACEVPAGQGALVGTRVFVEAGGRRMVRDVSSSGSYLSCHSPVLHFGLGGADTARVEVHWPDGSHTEPRDVPVNQRVMVRKGE